MQHKVVCKRLLKAVCGRSILFFHLLQVSKSVRLTPALINKLLWKGFHVFVQHLIRNITSQSVQDTHEQGLLLCWYSLNVEPGIATDWKYDDEVNNKTPNRIPSAGTAAESEQKMRIYSSASIAANPMLCDVLSINIVERLFDYCW